MDTKQQIGFIMSSIDILSDWKLCHRSKKSLRRQLEEHLASFIKSAEPGTHLPPERLIATTLSISRVTVRAALNVFYESGEIIRQGRNGTIVAPRNNEESEPLNELAIGVPWLNVQSSPLRFLLYENMPAQKIFWEETVREYSKAHPENTVELVWMSRGFQSRIADSLEENSIDVFLCHPDFSSELPSVAYPLPEPLKKKISSSEYLYELFCPERYSLHDYVLPLDLVSPLTFWNKKLAEQCGLSRIRERLLGRELCPLIVEALPHLPPDCMAGFHIWDYINYQGFPKGDCGPEHLLETFRELSRLPKFPNVFQTTQDYSRDSIDNFIAGKQLFLQTTRNSLGISSPEFPFETVPIAVKPGTTLLSSPVGIAISMTGRRLDAAENFLEFLISEPVQARSSRIKLVAPIHRRQFEIYMDETHHFSAEESRRFLERTHLFCEKEGEKERLSFFLVFHIRQELRMLMEGKLSPEKTYELVAAKWTRFHKMKNEREKNKMVKV